MEIYEVRFLQEALEDLEEIVLYISRNNRTVAFRIHDEIIKKVNDLTVFPKRGRLVPDKKMSQAGFRMLFSHPYIIFYRVMERCVFIYRVLHGSSNYPVLYEKILLTDGEE